MIKYLTTKDIYDELCRKYISGDFRIIGNDRQQSRTIEIQNANFIVDKPWIIREPNYEYFNRELEWYKSQSLNVNDIPGGAPKMWKACADKDGYINSNYGWCIWSGENGYQYQHCLNKLIEDPHTREACMLYTRPEMQEDYKLNGMHDFICTYSVQVFINENKDGEKQLDYIVYMRSNDAVYGFDNDALWHMEVQNQLAQDLSNRLNDRVNLGDLYWNAGSLHVYERHFNLLNPEYYENC